MAGISIYIYILYIGIPVFWSGYLVSKYPPVLFFGYFQTVVVKEQQLGLVEEAAVLAVI
jgi:hypothetical protein